MRAVMMERGRLWVDDLPIPEPGPGEVLVATQACGICGSDLHAARHTEDFVKTSIETGGAFKLTTFDPVVMGHEFCAELIDHGPDTQKNLRSGQLICSIPVLLREDHKHLAVGYSNKVPGGFGEYMILSERMLLPVPDGIPAKTAALTEPLAVGYHAVNKARLAGDEACLVLGCGPVGLAVITALKARGAGPVVGVDFSTGRRQFAAGQGADSVCDPDTENPYALAELANRRLVIFECVGIPGMIDNIFARTPNDAHIVVVGVCLQTDHIRPLVAVNKELSMQFVLGYTPEEFRHSLASIADGQFDVTGLVSHEIGLNGVAEVFEALRDPERYAKVIIDPTLE